MELHHRLRLRRPGPYLLDHESRLFSEHRVVHRGIEPRTSCASCRRSTGELLDRIVRLFLKKTTSPSRGSNPATPRYEGGASPMMLEGQRSAERTVAIESPRRVTLPAGATYQAALSLGARAGEQLPGVAPGPRGWQPRVSLARPELQIVRLTRAHESRWQESNPRLHLGRVTPGH